MRRRLPAPLAGKARPAFTLVEALLGVSITAICGSAVMLGLSSALDSSDQAIERLTALGLAQTYLAEMLCQQYCEPGATAQGTLGPETGETNLTGRQGYDDVDDYQGLSNLPPSDAWNTRLGADDGAGGLRHPNFQLATSVLQNFRVTGEVYYVSGTDLTTRLSGSSTSNYRAVHVRVFVDDPTGSREVVNLRRVIGYVPAH